MTAPEYAVASVTQRTTVADLDRMIAEIPPDDTPYPDRPPVTKAEKMALIKFFREKYWNNRVRQAAEFAGQQRPATSSAPRKPLSVRPRFDGLTASDCDAFLATLPPVPLWGEDH